MNSSHLRTSHSYQSSYRAWGARSDISKRNYEILLSPYRAHSGRHACDYRALKNISKYSFLITILCTTNDSRKIPLQHQKKNERYEAFSIREGRYKITSDHEIPFSLKTLSSQSVPIHFSLLSKHSKSSSVILKNESSLSQKKHFESYHFEVWNK